VNGLPQGSVLASTLFNLYTKPATKSRRIVYTDGIGCASFAELEQTFSADMLLLEGYCKNWRLTLSVAKRVSSVFHLQNASANRELNVSLNGQRLKHEPNPVYLGVTLDRSLTYRAHLSKLAAKVKTRNNLLNRLAGSTWGAGANTLRSTALALSYSTAEYCAPVWARSAHTNMVDVQLNCTMRTISGTIRSTPLPWLSVLCNIAPAHIRRDASEVVMAAKVRAAQHLPLHDDLFNHPPSRLKSRRPMWMSSLDQEANVNSRWREEWSRANTANQYLVVDPTIRLPGFDLPRRPWVSLNRFRTGHGRCGESEFRWGLRDNPNCSCGQVQTMIHIVEHCPLTRLKGGLLALNIADDDAIAWLSQNRIR
jgi:hypothetical protein